MDVVRMAELFTFRVLRNNLGQSLVEYILLLAVITSFGYAFYNNKRFKNFIAGKDGLFASMQKGISYSYRYGLEYKQDPTIEFNERMDFDYQTNKHDTYYNNTKNSSHFFVGQSIYPAK